MTTLLAVTGLSPAIVTETVWALAHENPPVLPARVVFATTSVGADRLRAQLFTPVPSMGGRTVWQALREALDAGADSLIAEPARIIGRVDPASGTLIPLADIATPEDNDTAASFLLEQVRGIAENPDTRLIASIAGGRKTMGALLHAAVSLIGRETDRLTHVLVSPPFETLPGFFFPGQPGGPLTDREGRARHPCDATIGLADVPFVPLRNRFADLSEMPGSFSGLVTKFARVMRQDASRPADISIHYRAKNLTVNGQTIPIRPKALAVLHFLLQSQEKGRHFTAQKELDAPFAAWLRKAPIPEGLKPAAPVTVDDIRHELSEVRTRLRAADAGWTLPMRSLLLPPFRLTVE